MGRKGRQRDAGAVSAGDFWGFAVVAGCIVSAVALASSAYSAPDPAEQTLAAVQDCMTRTPAPWPQAWQEEYIETIRRATAPDPNTSQYTQRLEILREGFPLYWTVQKFSAERSHFEVRQAQIRWYVENLMNANLPGEEETARLRRQYEELANHAAEGLVTQFSFLDSNRVREAKAAYLADCYRRIDAPLLPIFLMPLSAAQRERLQERWHDLRYARVDLWRQLGRGRTGQGTLSDRDHPDYRLMKGSLDQWEAQIWALGITAPEYYQTAVVNDLRAQEWRRDAISRVRERESYLDSATQQTEYLVFLLAALLETARDEFSAPVNVQEPPPGDGCE